MESTIVLNYNAEQIFSESLTHQTTVSNTFVHSKALIFFWPFLLSQKIFTWKHEISSIVTLRLSFLRLSRASRMPVWLFCRNNQWKYFNLLVLFETYIKLTGVADFEEEAIELEPMSNCSDFSNSVITSLLDISTNPIYKKKFLSRRHFLLLLSTSQPLTNDVLKKYLKQ